MQLVIKYIAAYISTIYWRLVKPHSLLKVIQATGNKLVKWLTAPVCAVFTVVVIIIIFIVILLLFYIGKQFTLLLEYHLIFYLSMHCIR